MLARAGFRVIAPDLRGFGESHKPEAVEDYAVSRSRADMIAVLDALGLRRAHVVGHDWGAGVAWMLAALTPRPRRAIGCDVGRASKRTARTINRAKAVMAGYRVLFPDAQHSMKDELRKVAGMIKRELVAAARSRDWRKVARSPKKLVSVAMAMLGKSISRRP